MGQTIKIRKEDAVLVVIDLQEKLMPAMHKGDETEKNAAMLIRGSRMMGVPVIATQQYTKGLGETIQSIRAAMTEALEDLAPATEFSHVEKTSFSAMGEPTFVQQLNATGRKTVVLCGVETHVCVMQTALDLLEAGYGVFVTGDCVDSRKKSDKKAGFRRMIESGAMGTTSEAVLFELLRGAKETGFKQISKLVK